MRVQCDCGKALNVADHLTGKKIKCPGCGAVLTVSGPPAAAAGDEDEALVQPKARPPAAAEEEDEAPAPTPAKKPRPPADEDDEEEAAPKPKRKAAASSTALAGNKFVVKEQKGFFSSGKAYEIVDADSSEAVATATEKSGMMAKLLGSLMGKDNMSLTIEVVDKADKTPLFSVRRSGFFFKKVEALDEDGKSVGTYKTKKFSLSGGFHIYDKAGKHFAEIRGKMFGSDYKFYTPDGETEMGSVGKSWGGVFKALFTGAETYGVQIAPEYADDPTAKILLLGAAIVIDALFKKAGGGGGGGGGGDDGGGGGDE
jgi:uncharacterized protein YxjI